MKKNNVYELCEPIENELYKIRLINELDLDDLYLLYSDKKSLRYINDDNCDDNFYYPTKERMKQALDFWLKAYYEWKCFVRYSLIDKTKNYVFGTIELFHRDSDDEFTNCAFLRLDLQEKYEKASVIENILQLFIPKIYIDFDADKIVTKNFDSSKERVEALNKLNFIPSNTLISIKDKTFGSYTVRKKI